MWKLIILTIHLNFAFIVTTSASEKPYLKKHHQIISEIKHMSEEETALAMQLYVKELEENYKKLKKSKQSHINSYAKYLVPFKMVFSRYKSPDDCERLYGYLMVSYHPREESFEAKESELPQEAQNVIELLELVCKKDLTLKP